ncbi:MAG: mannonate dehydratase [Nitrososphaeria archaeon]
MEIGVNSYEKDTIKLLNYCHQIGVNHVCLASSTINSYIKKGYLDYEELKLLKELFERNGIRITAMIITDSPSQHALLYEPGSEKEREAFCLTLETLGKVGIDTAVIFPKVVEPINKFKKEEYWRKIEKFYEIFMSTAENAHVKVANHAFYRSWSMIKNTKSLSRLLKLIPSQYNGITYCPGIYLMGDNPYEAITLFSDKIFLAHIRNLRIIEEYPGYKEVFLTEGDLDINKILELLEAIGFRGIICPEHLGKKDNTSKDLQVEAIRYLKNLLKRNTEELTLDSIL